MNYLQPYLTNVIRKHHLKKRNEEPHKSGTSTLELNLLTPLNEGISLVFARSVGGNVRGEFLGRRGASPWLRVAESPSCLGGCSGRASAITHYRAFHRQPFQPFVPAYIHIHGIHPASSSRITRSFMPRLTDITLNVSIFHLS